MKIFSKIHKDLSILESMGMMILDVNLQPNFLLCKIINMIAPIPKDLSATQIIIKTNSMMLALALPMKKLVEPMQAS